MSLILIFNDFYFNFNDLYVYGKYISIDVYGPEEAAHTYGRTSQKTEYVHLPLTWNQRPLFKQICLVRLSAPNAMQYPEHVQFFGKK